MGEVIQTVENHCDHVVVILDANDKELVSFPSKGRLRVEILPDDPVVTILGVPFKHKQKYETKGIALPQRRQGIIYIVPQHVWNACPDRDDFCYPGDKVRANGNGRILGCHFLRLNR